MKSRSQNLLVTGGAGFIGSNFINHVLNKFQKIKVYNLDLLTYAGSLSNTKKFSNDKRYKFIHGNICDDILLNNIFKNYNIDGIINFAAESHVDNSIIKPEEFIKTNINGVFNLLNVAYKNWMKSPNVTNNDFKFARFHQVSTDEVYGSIKKGSFSENSPYMPNSPYSATKAAADMLVRSFNKTYGLNTTISVSSNNYGLNQNKEKLIPKIISQLNNNKKVPLYGDGLNVRDWLHVKDNSIAIELIFNNSNAGETYNVGANNELSNLMVYKKLFSQIFNHEDDSEYVIFTNDRPGHDFRYSINCSKIKSELKWEPIYDFDTEICKLIDQYK
tara:strand:+ start:1427 stop:2419 length:993 start_codon:yes stop_codon:yes gene_type:complete